MAQFNLSITLEYDIVTASDIDKLVTEVNKRLQSGEDWQPLGGAFAYKGILCQTIAREEPKEVLNESFVMAKLREGFERGFTNSSP